MKRNYLTALCASLFMLLLLSACGNGAETESNSGSINSSEESTIASTEETMDFTEDEILADAIEFSWDNFNTDMKENKIRAEEKYIGNAFLITGYIVSIENDHVDVSVDVDAAVEYNHYNMSGSNYFTVPLPVDTIVELNNDQRVTIVGKIDSFSSEDSQEVVGGFTVTKTKVHGVMSNCYLVNDTFEISGKLIFYYQDVLDSNGKDIISHPGDIEYWTLGIDAVDDSHNLVNYSMKDDILVNHVLGKNVDTVNISGTELHSDDMITVSAKIIEKNLQDVQLISVDN